jgi:FkbM family methyltransferase
MNCSLETPRVRQTDSRATKATIVSTGAIKMSIVQRAAGKISRIAKKACRIANLRHKNFLYMPPNFLYSPTFTKDSIIGDVGCGQDADFAVAMINTYGVKAYVIDPTRKHQEALSKLVAAHRGRLIHLPFALSAKEGVLTFHESKSNESGSLYSEHVNAVNDETIIYDVKAINLRSLVELIGVPEIDMLKLDLEGAEYSLLSEATKEDLSPFKQIFVEFHHHAVPIFTTDNTFHTVKKMIEFGFDSYSLDDHNFLFEKRVDQAPALGVNRQA